MLSLILALILAQAEPAAAPVEKAPPPPSVEGGPAKAPPLSSAEAVDADGVPAWAKRKHKQPVQSCETRPNIGVETWRQRFESAGQPVLKPKPETFTCH
ncbi:hypothetical protein [Phenylobacterium sp.]|uniref:hypothetical protein n=1 Tax=Phenylobacterium sp. TaxID=1871053 RepID=UPI0025F7240D|nr:hypothetical protein [Phenylobacterium sp.]MBX3483794.1 hypothetical protein [Phenylobacterium sp.]MCW5758626.1 hypothetical protein [Phenylobacterium sp.]